MRMHLGVSKTIGDVVQARGKWTGLSAMVNALWGFKPRRSGDRMEPGGIVLTQKLPLEQ